MPRRGETLPHLSVHRPRRSAWPPPRGTPSKVRTPGPGQVQVTGDAPSSRARNFAAAAATEVPSSGMTVQTFPFTDLVASSVCCMPTWSPGPAKGGGGQPPSMKWVIFSGSGLTGQCRERSAVRREDAPDLLLHGSGEER